MFRNTYLGDFGENIFDIIGKEKMLITAGNKNGFNTMTASWGFMGEMWGESSVAVVVRPQRYTMEFIDNNDYFSLCFFGKGEENEAIHKICGSKSGRDTNKVELTGLTPITDERYAYFNEARMVILCKKQYVAPLSENGFINADTIKKWYPKNDLHNLCIGSIERIYYKEKDE